MQNQAVIFKGATSLNQFQAQFVTCPFGTSCPVNSPNGAQVNMGQPTGTVGTIYYYSSMTINNQPCNSPGSMGLRVKSSP